MSEAVANIPVYYEAFRVGTVDVSARAEVAFAYDPHWLQSRGAFPLSVTLPLTVRTYETAVVLPWLANLLPEEQQLAALTRSLGVSQTDVISILTAIGGDTAGALTFGQPSARRDWAYVSLEDFYGVTGSEAALSRHFNDLRQRPFLAGEDGVRLSLAGGQVKTTLTALSADGRPGSGLPGEADLLAIPLNGAPSSLIIKPDNPLLPGIVENEAYCLTLANAIGIPAAQASILKVGDRNALAVARYDRVTHADGTLRRRHQEDFAQANSVYPAQKYEQGVPSGPSIKTLLATGRVLSARDTLGLVDQLIFNILVANTDGHAKNYSLLIGPVISLAPLYDVSSVLPWPHVNPYFAQKLADKKRKPADMAARHWDIIAAESGLNARQLRIRVQELIDLIFKAAPEVADKVSTMSGALPAYVEQVRSLIETNALRIGGRLRS